jgi:hypothetical protein
VVVLVGIPAMVVVEEENCRQVQYKQLMERAAVAVVVIMVATQMEEVMEQVAVLGYSVKVLTALLVLQELIVELAVAEELQEQLQRLTVEMVKYYLETVVCMVAVAAEKLGIIRYKMELV